MLEFLEYIVRWVQIVPWIVICASLIASLTPTPSDDMWIKKVYSVLDWMALNVGKAKDK